MRRIIYCIILLTCLLLAGCGQGDTGKSLEQVKEELSKINTYTCDVVMKVTNNRSTMVYKLKHYYKSPDKYRIEVIEPAEMKGQTTISNGTLSYIYHPEIKQYLVTEKFLDSFSHSAFFSFFKDELIAGYPIDISWEKTDSMSYFVGSMCIPGEQSYRDKEKIWIDALRMIPVKIEIYDRDGKRMVEVLYKNFKTNPMLDDKMFEIEKKN